MTVDLDECIHSRRELRRRPVRGGAVQYVEQCLDCGCSLNQPMARVKVMAQTRGKEPPPFDQDVLEQRRRNRLAARDDERERYRARYYAYLASPEWDWKRSLVLKRCHGICEGCGVAPASQVHHLTYQHVFAELLFELVGVCSTCHEAAHTEPEFSP